MPIKAALFLISLLSAVLLLSAQSAEACSCGGNPTVIDSLEKSENVLIAEISAIEKSVDARKGVKGAKVIVKKVYKGALKEGETIFFDQGSGSDCLWEFEERLVGAKLLIYDSDSPFPGRGEFTRRGIHGCGRSQFVDSGSPDLPYLENLDKVRGKTRIYGYFSNYTDDDGSFEIKIFKGQTGKLRVQMFFSKKALEIYPAIKQADIEDRSAETVLASIALTGIKADRDLTGIRLVFPFPNCPRQY